MPKISEEDGGWDIPFIGIVNGTETMARSKALENPDICIKYAAAYLKYFQDVWKDSYNKIDGKTDILATLFNLGHEITKPNFDPKPNDFGVFAKDNYYYIKKLLE